MIVTLTDLPKIRQKHSSKSIVFGGGTFDLVHRGHLKFLSSLRERGDIVVVSVAHDKRVRAKKGFNRPVLSHHMRVALIDSLKFVDYALIAPSGTVSTHTPKMTIICKLRPDVFVTRNKAWSQQAADIKKYGTRLLIDPSKKEFSTTRIVNKILTTAS